MAHAIKVILLSTDAKLYGSFQRVFTCYENISLLRIMNAEAMKNERKIIIIYAKDRDSLYKCLWGDVRVTHKQKHPVIALSYHSLDSSEDVRDKVFERLWQSHVYFRIPFDLKDLVISLAQLSPLKNIRDVVKEYSDTSGLLVIAFHDIRGFLGGDEMMSIAEKKERICNLLSQIKELLRITAPGKIKIDIDNIMSQINRSELSEGECNRFILLIRSLEKEVFQ